MFRSLAVTILACLLLFRSVGAQSDVAALVSAARQALRGDKTLDTISSLAISGSELSRHGSAAVSASIEISYVAPDRFLRVSQQIVDGPISFDITNYDGFSGDEPIRETVAPNSPFPVVISAGPPPSTAEEVAAARAQSLAVRRETFLKTMAPLFVATPAAFGFEMTTGGKVDFNKAATDTLVIKRADGKSWRLLLDASTHLPVAMMWMAKPIVSTSMTTMATATVRTGPGGAPITSRPPDFQPAVLPAGDPTVGLADVQWTMTIGDYKVGDGVNWPRRFRTSVEGKESTDFKVSKYKLNPRIDPRIFQRRK